MVPKPLAVQGTYANEHDVQTMAKITQKILTAKSTRQKVQLELDARLMSMHLIQDSLVHKGSEIHTRFAKMIKDINAEEAQLRHQRNQAFIGIGANIASCANRVQALHRQQSGVLDKNSHDKSMLLRSKADYQKRRDDLVKLRDEEVDVLDQKILSLEKLLNSSCSVE